MIISMVSQVSEWYMVFTIINLVDMHNHLISVKLQCIPMSLILYLHNEMDDTDVDLRLTMTHSTSIYVLHVCVYVPIAPR